VPRHAPVVPLLALLQLRFPDLVDPVELITDGAILVDGMPAASAQARVRADATIRLPQSPQLRGTVKLSAALAAFGVDVGRCCRARPGRGRRRVHPGPARCRSGPGLRRRRRCRTAPGVASSRLAGDQPGAHEPGRAGSGPDSRAGQSHHHGPFLPVRRRRHRPVGSAAAGTGRTTHRAGQADLRAAQRWPRRPSRSSRRRREHRGTRAETARLAGLRNGVSLGAQRRPALCAVRKARCQPARSPWSSSRWTVSGENAGRHTARRTRGSRRRQRSECRAHTVKRRWVARGCGRSVCRLG
jgi:hypothetical protein